MGFEPRKQATKYQVKDGDTLDSVAGQAGVTKAELCKFNFGTTQLPEVNRALVELVGCRKKSADGTTFVFSSKDAKRGSGALLLPKKYKKSGLPLDKTNTVKVNKPKPATAAAIVSLDKWFLPKTETCDFKYTLEGDATRANKVVAEVYASNYCDATVDSRHRVRFKIIRKFKPVYEKDLGGGRPAVPSRGVSQSYAAWKGETSTDKGALQSVKASADSEAQATTNYVNVAFSPYTLLIRYYKKDADKDARVTLRDFWPQWDDKGKLNKKSLWIRWRVEKCSKLKAGQLLIVDKTDKVVFRHSLKASDLKQNRTKSFKWDGKLDDGTMLQAAKMPYRVQLQAHTDMDEDDGVGLAAMHTEVRLYVHKDTGTKPAKDAYKETDTLTLSMAPLVPEVEQKNGRWVTKVPDRTSEQAKWYQYKLADGGYHPGPVDGSMGRSDKVALQEFQRSYPANTTAPYTRLDARGRRDAATTAALARLTTDHHAWFGDPANRNDLTRANALLRLRDPKHAKGLLVWVDDRNYYTIKYSRQPYLDRSVVMRNYHGDFALGDNKLSSRTKSSVARPWIPLMVDIPVLKKDSGNKGLEADNKVCDDTTRKVLGPLRVNWTFDEIGEDLSVIKRFVTTPAHQNYDKSLVRSHRFIKEVVTNPANKNKLAKKRKGKVYTNCPSTVRGRRSAGVRPSNLRTYYRVPFGRENSSLLPWRAAADSRTETVATLVHTDMGQGAGKVYRNHVGRAGVFLHLSQVAGDGYRFRAQVGFDRMPRGTSNFPNMAVLKKRYTKLPKADTCALRCFKKVSIKGYVSWCRPGEIMWPSYLDGTTRIQTETRIVDLYSAAQIHIFREPGPNTALAYNNTVTALMNQALYRRVITRTVRNRWWRGQINKTVLNASILWPYHRQPHLGFKQGGLGTTTSNFFKRVIAPAHKTVWYKLCYDLMLVLIQAVERLTGRFKGHLQVQFRSAGRVNMQQYKCSRCGRKRTEIINNTTPFPATGGTPPRPRWNRLLLGTQCPRCRRRGKMQTDGASVYYDNLNLAAIGLPMGGVFLYEDLVPMFWAHEIGHNRHLEHSQAQFGNSGKPGGYKNAQHDSARNSGITIVGGKPRRHNRCWDRRCVMGYSEESKTKRNFFCGKCLLKLRGWAVERIRNPGGGVKDA